MVICFYPPFILAAFYCYDWKPRKQIAFIGSVFGVDVVMFVGVLGWI